MNSTLLDVLFSDKYSKKRSLLALLLVGAFVLTTSGELYSLRKEVTQLQNDLASTTLALTYTADILSSNFNALSRETASISTILSQTEKSVQSVSTKVGGVEQTVGTMSGAVNTLQKLSELEKEILQKYSKVYFLNEHYVPERLTSIPSEYLYTENKKEQFSTEGWRYLEGLLSAAKKENVALFVQSGYRSYDKQKSLKSAYTVRYGTGANTFSADQGYSEHQLGTAVDFITTGQGGQLSGFEKTKAYEWLQANAHNYGFILSYPKGNAYYIFEPWHWRFVGVKLATFLYNNKLNFYDLDQREIDTYLIAVFE